MPPEVTAAVVHSHADAELMVGMLHEHGVHAWVPSADAVEPGQQAQRVRVMVDASHEQEALALIAQKPAGWRELNGFQRRLVKLLGKDKNPPS